MEIGARGTAESRPVGTYTQTTGARGLPDSVIVGDFLARYEYAETRRASRIDTPEHRLMREVLWDVLRLLSNQPRKNAGEHKQEKYRQLRNDARNWLLGEHGYQPGGLFSADVVCAEFNLNLGRLRATVAGGHLPKLKRRPMTNLVQSVRGKQICAVRDRRCYHKGGTYERRGDGVGLETAGL